MSNTARPIDPDFDPAYPPVTRPPFIAADFARDHDTTIRPGYVSGRLIVRSPGKVLLNVPSEWFCDCQCGAKRVRKVASPLRGRTTYWCSNVCPLRNDDLKAIRRWHKVQKSSEDGVSSRTSLQSAGVSGEADTGLHGAGASRKANGADPTAGNVGGVSRRR